MLEITNHLIYQYLSKEFELANIDYKVEFNRDDYNTRHIIATILCNQRNCKTVGIQHVAIPHISPYLCYVHFDKYIVYGDLFVNHFAPYWSGMNLERTGRESIDWIANLIHDKETVNILKKRFRKIYPDRSYTVVIVLPSGAEFNRKMQWDALYDALCALRTVDIDCNVFLRFRQEEDLVNYEHLRRFRELPKRDERIHIDHENFTTYELMAICNLLIANSASFAINEALITKAKIFSFDFIGFAKDYFPDYGDGFILYTKEDLLKVFNGLKTNFSDFDCDWERLKKDCNYHYDGKNLERIQKVVLDTVRAVEYFHQKNETRPLSLKKEEVYV